MVKPSVDRLHPFFPGSYSGFGDIHFYTSQMGTLKYSKMIAHNFVQVNRLWRSIAERFLYSALYVREEWRVQKFIDTVKLNPHLAKLLRTLIIVPRARTRGVTEVCFGTLVEQVLSLCHGINAIVTRPPMLTNSLHLFQSLNSSRRLLLLSALRLPNEEFLTFMINFNNYASLQVLELSVTTISIYTFPTFPEHITFPSLRALLLGYLDPLVVNVVGKWELPSLKELSISQWNPLISAPLLYLIQDSYERLVFFDTCVDLLHDPALHDIIRAPPFRLRNVTLNIATSANSSPPMHPAIKPFFGHVVTLGISNFGMTRPEYEPAWVRFFSDPTYIPHLRSVLTDVKASLLDILCPFGEALEDRGVAFKVMMDDGSSFVPTKRLQRGTLEVSALLCCNNGLMLISSPASICSPWELRSVST